MKGFFKRLFGKRVSGPIETGDRYDAVIDPVWGYTPNTIPTTNTDHEEVITAILERAREKAKELESGSTFTVDLEESEMDAAPHPMIILGPIMMRADDYGLMPGMSIGGSIEFTKL